MPRYRTDLESFPVNDAGEPLMDARDWYYEQIHDTEIDWDDPYDDRADAYEENPNDYV